MENEREICQALEDFRKKSLTEFMKEFIPLLEQEGYSFLDLIDSLASYAHSRELERVVYELEEASNEYRKAQKNAQLPTDSNPN